MEPNMNRPVINTIELHSLKAVIDALKNQLEIQKKELAKTFNQVFESKIKNHTHEGLLFHCVAFKEDGTITFTRPNETPADVEKDLNEISLFFDQYQKGLLDTYSSFRGFIHQSMPQGSTVSKELQNYIKETLGFDIEESKK